jgi:hypothetical protein
LDNELAPIDDAIVKLSGSQRWLPPPGEFLDWLV